MGPRSPQRLWEGPATGEGGARKKASARELREAREKLERIIEECEAVEAGKLDPFALPVEMLIEAVRELFPLWEEPEDLALDARAVEAISGVVKAQSEWVRERSTRLYRDPFLVEERLERLPAEAIARIFLKAWHPIVELEQLTPLSLEMAMKYWHELPGREEREEEAELPELPLPPAEAGEVVSEDVQEATQALWSELKARARGGSVPYWDFITADTYAETVRRAYLTSFLVTYGYAKLEVDPLSGELVLRPRRRPRTRPRERATSLVIPITYERWMERAS